MKKDLKQEIKNLNIAGLNEKIKAAKIAVADLIMDKNMNKLTDKKVVFKKRKELALLQTVLQQKQQLNVLEKIEVEKPVKKETEQSSRVKHAKTKVKIATKKVKGTK